METYGFGIINRSLGIQREFQDYWKQIPTQRTRRKLRLNILPEELIILVNSNILTIEGAYAVLHIYADHED